MEEHGLLPSIESSAGLKSDHVSPWLWPITPPGDDVRPYQCPVCLRRWKNINGLRYHQEKSRTACNTEWCDMDTDSDTPQADAPQEDAPQEETPQEKTPQEDATQEETPARVPSFVVYVLVDQPAYYATEYSLDHSLAAAHSPICRARMNRNQYFFMIGGDPTVFEFLGRWLYTQSLKGPTLRGPEMGPSPEMPDAEQTLHLWIMADKLGIGRLQNQAVDHYFELTAGLGWGEGDGYREVRPASNFADLWRKSKEDSKLRMLLICRHAGWSITKEANIPPEQRIPPDIRADVLILTWTCEHFRSEVSREEFYRTDMASWYYVKEG